MSIQNIRTIEKECKDFLCGISNSNEDVCVYQWLIDNKIISLYRKDDDLSYRYIDKVNEKDIVGPINFGQNNDTVEKQIALLAKCLPKLNQDNVVYFSNPEVCHVWEEVDITILYYARTSNENNFGTYKSKIEEKKELKLLWKPNELLWCIVAIKDALSICTTFKTAGTKPSVYCSETGHSYSMIENLQQFKKEDIISILGNSVRPRNIEIAICLSNVELLIHKAMQDSLAMKIILQLGYREIQDYIQNYIETRQYTHSETSYLVNLFFKTIVSPITLKVLKFYDYSLGPLEEIGLKSEFEISKILSVYLEPKSAKSQIDERVRVSQYQWGVTLITYGGSSGNHARLIIEGLDHDLDYFMTHIHFTGEEEYLNQPIKPEDFTHRELRYKTRTEIWKRPSHKVKEMIDHMTGQMPSYSRYGRDSFFSDGKDNCFTWLREELQIIGVDLGTNPINSIAAITKLYTKIHADHLKTPVNDGEIV